MKRMFLPLMLVLVVAVLVAGSPVSAVYIDRVTIFEPGTHNVYNDFPGEASLTSLCNQAAMLSNHAKNEEALQMIEKAIKIDPTIAKPYYIKGLILFNMNRFEDAIEAFDWGIKIDPSDKDAKYRAIAASKLTV